MKTTSLLRLALAAFPLVLVTSIASAQNTQILDQKRVIPYRITVRDHLTVSITQEDDLRATPWVNAKGNVSLVHIGEVYVYGQTIIEAQKTIENAYRDNRILRHPQAIVSVEEYAPRRITVTGAVKQQGYVDMPIETAFTVADAIIKAGLGDTARGKAVKVTRTLPDGTTKSFEIDVESVLKGKKATSSEDNSLILEPNDVIFVPEKII